MYRFLLCLCLCACSAPQDLSIVPATPTPQPTSASMASVLQTVPSALQGDWIETQQAFAPAAGESYGAFRQRLIQQLEAGGLELPETQPETEGNPTSLPYRHFYNGYAPVLHVMAADLSWTDVQPSPPGAAEGDTGAASLGYDGQHLVYTTGDTTVHYYVSKDQRQLVQIPAETGYTPAYGITVYLREAETKTRYGMCFNPTEGNAISCGQLAL